MQTRDPYDVSVAFDDVFVGDEDGPAPPPPRDLFADRRRAAAAREILRRAAAKRLPPPPMRLRVVGTDPTPESFSFKVSSIVPSGLDFSHYDALVNEGYINDYSVIGAAPVDGKFPLFDSMREQFARALPRPKYVRWDDRKTYVGFREERQKPYLENLERRLAALESTVADHVSDDHGGGKVAALQRAFADRVNYWHSEYVDVLGAELDRARVGGERISVPRLRGKVECWQDGREILCTARFPGRDSQVHFATTGEDVAPYVQEVLGCAIGAGAAADDFIEVAPRLVQLLGASALVAQLCRAAPEIILAPEADAPYVGVVQPTSDPSLAAAMALLQRCQRGDRLACREAEMMVSTEHEPFLKSAGSRLLWAQAQKRRRR